MEAVLHPLMMNCFTCDKYSYGTLPYHHLCLLPRLEYVTGEQYPAS